MTTQKITKCRVGTRKKSKGFNPQRLIWFTVENLLVLFRCPEEEFVVFVVLPPAHLNIITSYYPPDQQESEQELTAAKTN